MHRAEHFPAQVPQAVRQHRGGRGGRGGGGQVHHLPFGVRSGRRCAQAAVYASLSRGVCGPVA